MERHIQKKYFIGNSKPGQWSSVYTYKPVNNEIKDRRGEILAAISLKAPNSFAASTAGNLLIDYLHETYFENENDKALYALEKALIGTGKYLEKLLENDSAAEIGIELDIIATAIISDIAYFVSFGSGRVNILRDGNIVDLTEALRDPTGENLIKSGSMVLKRADVLIIGTPAVYDDLTLDSLLECAIDFSELPLKNKGYEEDPNLALMLVGYNVDRQEAKEEALLKKRIDELKAQKQEDEDVVEDQTIENEYTETDLPVAEEEKPDDLEAEELEEPEESEIEELDTDLEEGINIVKKATPQPILTENEEPEQISEEEQEVQEEEQEETEEQVEQIEEEPEKEPRAKINFSEKFSGIKSKFQDKLTSTKNAVGGRISKFKEDRKLKSANTERVRISQVNQMDEQERVNFNEPTYKVILQKIKLGLLKFLGKLKKLVWDEWLGFGKSTIYVKGGARKKNWIFLVILIAVVLSVLYFSIKGIADKQLQTSLETEAQGILTDADNKIKDLEVTAGFVAKANANDPRKTTVTDKLNEVKTNLNKISNLDKYKQEVKDKVSKIDGLILLMDKIVAVSDPRIIVDIGGLYPGADITDLTVIKGNLFASDKKYGKVYKFSYSGNDIKDLATGLNNPYSITADDKGNVITIDKDEEKAISIINAETGEQLRVAGTSSSKVGGFQQIEFLSELNGRIYGYDSKTQTVKYLQRNGTSYGLPSSNNLKITNDNVKDISINDLRVYVLQDKISRFYSGKEDSPKVNGLGDYSLANATAFYIDGGYIYVADPSQKTILIFSKDTEITLKAKFKYTGSDSSVFANIKELSADRENGKLFVLDGSRVYALDLNKLQDFL